MTGFFQRRIVLRLAPNQALRSAGKRVPADVAMVGVGDYEIAEFFDPPLTTAAGSNKAMVAKAIPLLFQQLEGSGAAVGEIFVTPSVCVRASSPRQSA